jgi:MFS family permease
MAAWTARFALFAFGNPGTSLWMLILSMGIFGIAFNFYNIAGMLYVESITDGNHKALGQGLLMMMSTGVGSTIGMVGAGAIINHFCEWRTYGDRSLLVGDWTTVWLIFAAYTLVLALAILPALHPLKNHVSK